MTLAAVSTALSISITLLIIVLVVVSLMMILVVMMQRPKQEGLGAAFGGGMTDQLLGAGTTSFLQKATVVLGILFFVLSLVLGILVGKSNKVQGLDVKTPVAGEQSAAPAPGIAEGVDVPVDEGEAKILEAIESAMEPGETNVDSQEESSEATDEIAPLEESPEALDEPAGETDLGEGVLGDGVMPSEESPKEVEDSAGEVEEVGSE